MKLHSNFKYLICTYQGCNCKLRLRLCRMHFSIVYCRPTRGCIFQYDFFFFTRILGEFFRTYVRKLQPAISHRLIIVFCNFLCIFCKMMAVNEVWTLGENMAIVFGQICTIMNHWYSLGGIGRMEISEITRIILYFRKVVSKYWIIVPFFRVRWSQIACIALYVSATLYISFKFYQIIYPERIYFL